MDKSFTMGFFDDNKLLTPPDDRVDGKQKVTGTAKYAAEYIVDNLVYGVLVGSTIAKGSIQSIDITAAKKAPGVIDIISHQNNIPLEKFSDAKKAKDAGAGLRIFYSNEIFSSGQPIALVVADHFEQAQYAAGLVKVTYTEAPAETDFLAKAAAEKNNKFGDDKIRGDKDAWNNATVKIEAEYSQPAEVHSPMEMHATIAVWTADDKLTVYDKNHAVKDVQGTIANMFGLKKENVLVQAEFVGGGFGSGLRSWPHSFAAIIAAKKLNRPVKVVVSRPQMFTMVGYRPHAWQRVALGANADGTITGAVHESITNTSTYENFNENSTGITKVLYNFQNLHTRYKTVPLNFATPIWMRAPGEATGSFALESAMDELAYALKMDPLELRLKNFAEKDLDSGLPWSSNFLKDCYDTAAAKFGWANRKATPRSTRLGDWWVGHGMGVGTWGAWRLKATARGRLDINGNLLLQSATSDMGPGTGTAMVAIANNVLGVPKEKIKFELGNSSFPDSPAQGGSFTVASVGSAVNDVCSAIKEKLLQVANETDNNFKDAKAADVIFKDGSIALAANPAASVSYTQLLHNKGLKDIDITKSSASGEETKKYSFNSYAVHFAEVHVHAYTGVVRVKRFVSCVDAGKIVSEKTAASQIKGAVVWGIGMALMEEQQVDHRYGRILGNDFAGYHIPVNADVPEIDVLFVNKPDPYLNAMGSKGLGEVGLIGSAAAIANAVFNATGKRIRQLPVTPDKLI
ncbi:xanthine dehydrogenase family protein molybdopterin-binding subunit [Ferruginibacter sp.]